MNAADPPRYHAFDALRAAAMLLGVFFHAALAYTDPPLTRWAIADSDRHWGVSVFAWGSHAFRMNVFFVMSGFFARLLVERRGPAGFTAHRLRRIGAPFAIGVVALNGAAWAGLAAAPPALARAWGPPQPYHLWFLEFLLVYAAGVVLVEWGRPRVAVPWLGAQVDRGFGRLLGSAWKPLWLAPPTLGLMAGMPAWGIDVPVGMVPRPDRLAYYGLFFGFGYMLYARADRLPALVRHSNVYLALGAALLPAPLLLLGQPAGGTSYRLAAHAVTALFTWLLVFGLMGAFLHVFRRSSPVARYLSDSAYWVYLTHIPIVPALQLALLPAALPGPLKYAAVCAATLALVYVSYAVGVRYTPVGALLHGPRARPDAARPSSGGAAGRAAATPGSPRSR